MLMETAWLGTREYVTNGVDFVFPLTQESSCQMTSMIGWPALFVNLVLKSPSLPIQIRLLFVAEFIPFCIPYCPPPKSLILARRAMSSLVMSVLPGEPLDGTAAAEEEGEGGGTFFALLVGAAGFAVLVAIEEAAWVVT
jgi:hypothetical protein